MATNRGPFLRAAMNERHQDTWVSRKERRRRVSMHPNVEQALNGFEGYANIIDGGNPLLPIVIVSVRCEDKPVPAPGSELEFCCDCSKPMWVGRKVVKSAL